MWRHGHPRSPPTSSPSSIPATPRRRPLHFVGDTNTICVAGRRSPSYRLLRTALAALFGGSASARRAWNALQLLVCHHPTAGAEACAAASREVEIGLATDRRCLPLGIRRAGGRTSDDRVLDPSRGLAIAAGSRGRGTRSGRRLLAPAEGLRIVALLACASRGPDHAPQWIERARAVWRLRLAA